MLHFPVEPYRATNRSRSRCCFMLVGTTAAVPSRALMSTLTFDAVLKEPSFHPHGLTLRRSPVFGSSVDDDHCYRGCGALSDDEPHLSRRAERATSRLLLSAIDRSNASFHRHACVSGTVLNHDRQHWAIASEILPTSRFCELFDVSAKIGDRSPICDGNIRRPITAFGTTWQLPATHR